MNILCVIDDLGSGGAQRQLVEIAMGFHESGHKVDFLTYHPASFYYKHLENAGIDVKCIQERNLIKRFFKMRSYIRGGNFNVVVSFLEGSNFICELSGLPFRRWKLIVGERNANPNITTSIKLRIYRWVHLFADHVISNSNANMKLVCSVNPVLPDSKCSVIFNIVDFNRWKPSLEYKIRKDGHTNLVVLSSHIYRKNLIGLINALLLLNNDERKKIRISWYGDRLNQPHFDGSLQKGKETIELNHLEEVISFYPAVHDITKVVQEADVVGLFSFYEGLPNAVIEGMACSKPIVSSSVSDIPFFLSHDTNLLFDPSSPKDIKRVLSYLIEMDDNELVQIGKRNEMTAKANFQRNVILEKYFKIIGN